MAITKGRIMSLYLKEKCARTGCGHPRHRHGHATNKADPAGKGRCRQHTGADDVRCPCSAFVERKEN